MKYLKVVMVDNPGFRNQTANKTAIFEIAQTDFLFFETVYRHSVLVAKKTETLHFIKAKNDKERANRKRGKNQTNAKQLITVRFTHCEKRKSECLRTSETEHFGSE